VVAVLLLIYTMPNDRLLNVLREAAVNKQEPALAFYLSSFHSLRPFT